MPQDFSPDFLSILDQSPDAIAKIDRQWRVVYLNKLAQQMLAASGDVIGKNHWESFPSADFEGSPWLYHYYRAMDEGLAGEFEHFYPEPLNIWMRILVRPLPDGIVVYFRDIGETRRAQGDSERANAELRGTVAHLEAIYATMHEYTGILDPSGTIMDCNEASLSFEKSCKADVVGLSFWEGPWFQSTPGMPELIRQVVLRCAAGETVRAELALNRSSGEVVSFDFSMTPIRNEAGEVVFLVPEGRDITALQRANDAHRASEERLRIAVETAQLGMWELDLTNWRMECSGQCKRNFGRPLNAPFDYPDLLKAIHEDDLQPMQASIREAIENRVMYRTEYRVYWPDGSVHWVVASGKALYAETGEPVRMIGVTLDVTERHVAMQTLMQTEKLAAVGRLASSIAHEINNPLESVTNLLYLAMHTPERSEAIEYMALADVELRRVAAISSQTLQFHRQSTRPRVVTCEDLFKSVLSVYQSRLLNAKVQVEKRKRARQGMLCFDGEIRQVLNNLVSNAIDSMQGTGGRLLLRSRETTEARTGRRGVVLTIADTGSGIESHALAHIFDPFFTTKGITGTGLGLWISRGIVDRHHGWLQIRTRVGRGTVFALFLPFESDLR